MGGNQWSSLQSLRDCIGDIDANVNNPIFEAEMARQRGDDATGEVSAPAGLQNGTCRAHLHLELRWQQAAILAKLALGQ